MAVGRNQSNRLVITQKVNWLNSPMKKINYHIELKRSISKMKPFSKVENKEMEKDLPFD